MKRQHLLTIVAVMLSSLGLLFLPSSDSTPRPSTSDIKLTKRDRIDLAMAQEVEMTRDPFLGYVPKEQLWEAYRYAERLRKDPGTRAALSNVVWRERGPNHQGGRTRAIMVDPNDPTGHTVWAAGVGGGLWKTTNIDVGTPDWEPVDDFFDNIAISSLAYDAQMPDTMYFGTGEGYFNTDAQRGLGVWKSTDGGQTWLPLASTQNSTFYYCYRIKTLGPDTVLVATRSGLRRSVNGGTTWSKVLGGSGVSNTIYDIEEGVDGSLYVSVNGGIHKSTNRGQSFSALTIPVSAERIELSASPADNNYIYALVENGNQVQAILRSTDAGASWQTRTEPNDADGGIIAGDFSRNQGWYNLCIAADPNDRDVVYVGGINLFKSSNGGNSWNQLSMWYHGSSFQYVHADQHEIIFEPGNSAVFYVGNDGGIYRTTDGTSVVPILSDKGSNYRTFQFYGCAMHPDSAEDYYLAGSQDNGSQKLSNPGLTSGIEVSGGDGAFCHIDQNNPSYQFTSYVYNNLYRSTNGGSSFNFAISSNNGRFINPSDYDNDAQIFYSAYNSGQYLRWNNPTSGNSTTNIDLGFGAKVSAVTCDPNVAHRVYFGIGNGRVYRVDGANTVLPTASYINSGAGMPGNYISCIAVEDGDTDHLLVTYSNYGVNSVWETTNGGTSWTSVEGNLPNMPVRSVLFNPNNASQAILATELGVWSTDNLNGGATNWGPSMTGLANTRVDMLQVRESDGQVLAATHGRGLFTSDIFQDPDATFEVDRKVTYLTKTVQFRSLSSKATSWLWDFGDSQTSTAQHPTHTYASPGVYTVSLTINGGAFSHEEKSYVAVLPDRGVPYSGTDGGNFEVNPNDFAAENLTGTAFERGISGIFGKHGTFSGIKAWVTGLNGNYANKSHSMLYTPSYDLTTFGGYTFRFRGRFRTESDFDGLQVEYSLNKGDSWTRLGDVQANWYNYLGTSQTAFPSNEPFFTGDRSTTFDEYYIDLTFLAGQPSVAFRFVFRSDDAVTNPGFAIDEVELDDYILPVEISELSGEWTGADALLQWETLTEWQNHGFELQRSADGQDFEMLGFVESKGNSQNGHAYTFTDTHPFPGTNLYRLRQVDLDGHETFSPTINLTNHFAQIAIYPNPTAEKVWVDLSAPATIRFFNLKGQEVLRQSLFAGKNEISISPLGVGTYLLEVAGKAEKLVVRR